MFGAIFNMGSIVPQNQERVGTGKKKEVSFAPKPGKLWRGKEEKASPAPRKRKLRCWRKKKASPAPNNENTPCTKSSTLFCDKVIINI